MPRRDLKVVGNHLSRCNNSSPRYKRENHYAILARLKISYVLKSQDKHNASYYSKCLASQQLAIAKLIINCENIAVSNKKINVCLIYRVWAESVSASCLPASCSGRQSGGRFHLPYAPRIMSCPIHRRRMIGRIGLLHRDSRGTDTSYTSESKRLTNL